jgi:anoctamin-7
VVKNYFGATTAMYFAFVGFYNMWLIGPAIIGIGVFIYGICQIPKNEMVRDICDSGKNFLMCPDCDSNSCDTYYLSDYCVTTAITSSANNGAVVVFSVVMMIWFAVFVSMWQRRQNTIAHLWGTTNSRDATAELRPKYTQTKTTEQRFNPVSGKLEVYVSFWNRLPQYTVAVTVVVMFLSCAALLLLSITIYNFTLYVTLRKYDDNSLWHKYAKELSSMITGSCSALVIQLLSLVSDCFNQGFILICIMVHYT